MTTAIYEFHSISSTTPPSPALTSLLSSIASLQTVLFPHLLSSPPSPSSLLPPSSSIHVALFTSSSSSSSPPTLAAFSLAHHRAGQTRITSLGTAPSHRRKGLARSLLLLSLSLGLVEKRCGEATLVVDCSERGAEAARLYEAVGFKRDGPVVDGYYSDGASALRMTLPAVTRLAVKGAPKLSTWPAETIK